MLLSPWELVLELGVVLGMIAELELVVDCCMVVRCSSDRGWARKHTASAAEAATATDQVVLAIDMQKAVEEEPAALETGEVADKARVTATADVERRLKVVVVQYHIQDLVHTLLVSSALVFAMSAPAMRGRLRLELVKEWIPVHLPDEEAVGVCFRLNTRAAEFDET